MDELKGEKDTELEIISDQVIRAGNYRGEVRAEILDLRKPTVYGLYA